MAFNTWNSGVWVNRSGTNISIYSGTVSSSIHTGGLTAGGTKVGIIYPNEMYSSVGNNNYITSVKIVFRDGNGLKREGYIETSPGYTLGEYAWVKNQEPFHYYNSNGSSLVSSVSTTIGGTSYRVFTINKPVKYRNRDGALQSTVLTKGMQIATNGSTPGQSYKDHMLFNYRRSSTSGSWAKFFPSSTYTYAFVDLSYNLGSMPSDRAIR